MSYDIQRTNTCVIDEEMHVILIDACSKDAAKEMKRKNLSPDYHLLTNEHSDHLWGLNAISSAFLNVQIVAQKCCNEAIGDPKRNKAKQYHIYVTLRFGKSFQN